MADAMTAPHRADALRALLRAVNAWRLARWPDERLRRLTSPELFASVRGRRNAATRDDTINRLEQAEIDMLAALAGVYQATGQETTNGNG